MNMDKNEIKITRCEPATALGFHDESNSELADLYALDIGIAKTEGYQWMKKNAKTIQTSSHS